MCWGGCGCGCLNPSRNPMFLVSVSGLREPGVPGAQALVFCSWDWVKTMFGKKKIPMEENNGVGEEMASSQWEFSPLVKCKQFSFNVDITFKDFIIQKRLFVNICLSKPTPSLSSWSTILL